MRRGAIVLAALAAVGAVAWGAHAWYVASRWVSTDDAYVEGTIAPVSARVGGHVVELRVRDNQAVARGELLLRIDPRDYQARRDQARAAVAVAEAALRAARSELPLAEDATRAQIGESRAALEGLLVAVRSAESAVTEAGARLGARRAAAAAMQAEVTAAEATQRKTARELARMQRLMANDYVSRREL
ncbi:MAG TPA: biotin/lipoyl-binding protein, partial [Methylomirabilota bacterium]|nr:biotin/lipoyl-binding protein [Methylomirabilota bacterium]